MSKEEERRSRCIYSERRRELLMLSLRRGGESCESQRVHCFCVKQRIRGLQSEQEKERKWGQEVLVPPPERRSHVKATVEILLCGERGNVHYTYTLKQLTLAKLQGIFGGVPIGFLGALRHHSGPTHGYQAISQRYFFS